MAENTKSGMAAIQGMRPNAVSVPGLTPSPPPAKVEAPPEGIKSPTVGRIVMVWDGAGSGGMAAVVSAVEETRRGAAMLVTAHVFDPSGKFRVLSRVPWGSAGKGPRWNWPSLTP